MEIGESAPPFQLRATGPAKTVGLDDLGGRKSLLVFIPFAFTNTCQGELCTIRDNMESLRALDANVVVITCDSHPVNRKWAEENGFDFPVLSDFWPHGEVTTAYGAFNDTYGAANRRTVVLDGDGVVREIIETDGLSVPRAFEDYLDALTTIP